jgi:serine/threonine protein kinase
MDGFRGTDRFELIRQLGTGGMGVVYEAFDREREQTVALKTLKHVDAQSIYRFKREFRSLAAIVHPHLISLHELFSDGDQWFFTMEMIEGSTDFLSYIAKPELAPEPPVRATEVATKTLVAAAGALGVTEKYVRELPGFRPSVVSHPARPLALREFDTEGAGRLRKAMRELVEGVAAIHHAGKLHRDLKPGNVLIRADGSVVVLDFGLVVGLQSPPPTTQSSGVPARGVLVSGSTADPSDTAISGTLAYMSPEQTIGSVLTEASDWYTVGVMLFEAITGQLPFRVKSWADVRRRTVEEAPAPADLMRGVPADLNSLTVDLLRIKPSQRPGPAEILRRLSDAAASDPAGMEDPAALFVGREAQREALVEAFWHLPGRTVVCQIRGKSGVGKTVLVEHFLQELAANHDALILSARCYEQESVPYKAIDAVIDALSVYLSRLSAREIALLIPPGISALARIFPTLQRVALIGETEGSIAATADLQELRRQTFAALRELLTRISKRQALVISIDDLQWGDVDSADLLSDLLRPPNAPPLFLLVSYRSEDARASACLDALRAVEALRDASIHCQTVSVDPLTPDESAGLALRLLHSEDAAGREAAQWIAGESGGNPYFVYELARHVRSGAGLGAMRGLTLDQVLWTRVESLPAEARELLEVVAVSGRPVCLRQAKQAAGIGALSPQVTAGLRAQHLVRSTGPGLADDFETYHDRIRESILAHLPAPVRKQHHGNLAVALEAAGDAAPEVLAAHFEGADLRDKAGGYFEAAAGEAIQALAFDRAQDFLERAENLLTDTEARARVQEKRIHFYTDLARFQDAYEMGQRAVLPFGVRLPDKFQPLPFLADLAETRVRILGRNVGDLADLPPMTDAGLKQAIRLVSAVGKAAYQLKPELCIQILTRVVKLCLRHGNAPDCPVAYMAFGSIFLGGVMGNHRVGYQFGRLTLDLAEKYQVHHQKAEVHFVVGYFGTSWIRPATEAERLWEIAYQSGLDSGDLFHMGCASCATVMSLFMRGVPMQQVWDESERRMEFLERAGLREPLGAVTAVRQAVRNLRGDTNGPSTFDTADFQEEEYVHELERYGSRHFAHYYFVVKSQCLYLQGEIEEAASMARTSQTYLKHSPGMLHTAEHFFYQALILAAQCRGLGGLKRAAQLRKLRSLHARFRHWAADCPDNFLHKERLLAAEIACLENRREDAHKNCAEAAEAAERYGSLPVQALAHRLAAELHRQSGRLQDCEAQAAEAAACFSLWGATDIPASSDPRNRSTPRR